MFSEMIHNWAKILELFTGTMSTIAIGMIPERGALRLTGLQARSYRTSVQQLAPETEREWVIANARIVSLNR